LYWLVTVPLLPPPQRLASRLGSPLPGTRDEEIDLTHLGFPHVYDSVTGSPGVDPIAVPLNGSEAAWQTSEELIQKNEVTAAIPRPDSNRSSICGMWGCQTMYRRYDPGGIRTPDLHRDRVAC
jgi:hypothetical protein